MLLFRSSKISRTYGFYAECAGYFYSLNQSLKTAAYSPLPKPLHTLEIYVVLRREIPIIQYVFSIIIKTIRIMEKKSPQKL